PVRLRSYVEEPKQPIFRTPFRALDAHVTFTINVVGFQVRITIATPAPANVDNHPGSVSSMLNHDTRGGCAVWCLVSVINFQRSVPPVVAYCKHSFVGITAPHRRTVSAHHDSM